MTQFTLKIIALLLMLMDHIVKVILPAGSLSPLLGMEGELLIRSAMLILGRAAFPMFAWFAAEGCRKTSNLGKYCLRLLLFGVLSEIPFQLCFYGAYHTGLQFGFHNVLFTMFLAVAAIYGGRLLEKLGTHKIPACICPALIAISLGWLLHTDYNAWGIALILGLYYLPEGLGKLGFLAAWVSVFQLLWHGWDGKSLVWLSGAGRIYLLYWLGGLFGVLLLATHAGKRGKDCKWLFYIFYPAHLALLFLLSRIL